MKNSISYARWLELQKYKYRSIQTLKSLQTQVHNYLKKKDKGISSESLKSFAYWASKEGYSRVYQKQLHWGIWVYCQYLKQVRGLKILPSLPRIKLEENRREALTKKQLKRISDWLSQKQPDYWLNQSLWSLFYGCGLRRTEALNLKLSNLVISEKLLFVNTLKGGKKRILPLSDKQLSSLVNYIEKERNKPREFYQKKLYVGRRGGKADYLLSNQLKKWQEGTGLGQQLSWHSLRHSIATELVSKGMDLDQVRQFLGHSSIESTSRYLHQNRKKYEF